MKLTSLNAIHFWGDVCLEYAAKDLARDLLAVTGKEIPVAESREVGEGILSIASAEDWECLEKARPCLTTIPTRWEEYTCAVLSDRIVILGVDKRGAMWGVYALSEKLGILPCHRFTLAKPEKKEEIREEEWSDRPRTFRFRGWFINDEDLLTKRILSGGKRDIDYPFYRDVCDVRSMEEAVETALRMGINLIIPGSLIDIDESWQRALVEYCIDRGFYVTQHHIEPVGVSWWSYTNYFKKQGEAPAFSYAKEKEKMKEVWHHYIRKWAKYGSNVIWQLGLRGKGDVPVWISDEGNTDMSAWGAFISEAIRTQYDLIREEIGEDFFSTATLWMEGAKMYADGSLTLPEGTIPIFSDVGCTQMMASDFYNTPRFSHRPTGIYYHAAYFGSGPHLAPGNNPEKMLWNYDLALEKGDREYSILNVSNVREVLYNAYLNSRIVWDRDSFDLSSFDRKFARDCFGNESLSFFYPDYFDAIIPGTIDDFSPKRRYAFDFVEADTPFPYYTVNDGDLKILGRNCLRGLPVPGENWQERIELSLAKFRAIIKKCADVSSTRYFHETLFFVTYFMCLEMWLKELLLYREDGDRAHLEEGARILEACIKERQILELAPFETWYRGDDKINLRTLSAMTRSGADEEYLKQKRQA